MADRDREAKVGAVTTLLGEAIGRHLDAQKALEGRQFALFDPGDQLPDDEEAGEAPAPGRRGRPPGARSKKTEAFRAFVRQRYGDPMLKLLERAFADPKVLATALGADSAWDVARHQHDILMRLMPFLHSAMPAEVKVQAKGALAVGLFGLPGGVAAGDQVIDGDGFAALVKFAENQGLSLDGAGLSNADASNAEPETPAKSEG